MSPSFIGNGVSMLKSKTTFLKSAALALTMTAPLAAGLAVVSPALAMAASTLPAPYVSRALDAVLMPVDAAVAGAFGLAAGTTGVLVVATDPGGLAAAAGIEPGDVIDFVRGEAILSPAELDEVVYYWIKQGAFDFEIKALRAGKPYAAATTVTLEAWESVIDVTVVESWSSYSYESFSYSEYYAEYSEEITESYESSESMIEESVTSEEFEADMMTEDEMAAAEDAAAEEAAAEDGTAEDGTAEDGTAEDGAADDAACDPATDPDCAGEADAAVDEGGDEAADDAGAEDDAAADDVGDEGGDEEPVE